MVLAAAADCSAGGRHGAGPLQWAAELGEGQRGGGGARVVVVVVEVVRVAVGVLSRRLLRPGLLCQSRLHAS